ncbi:FGGY-family carbohydrate kinase [Georgenia sp. EYE_87]|uniref:FGGY-family carbohydrate kinase n=1 Tax=Georgenia sp. EYE_87 TaxID=2853448 RepID=UPI002004BC4B|nr:FGGY-family carbohydrate kinase [Georgenia sp. EYE_87]MCK6211656.1 FGGY-family carbohydrate kinase [Georgenia sp. EYE_87]
MRRSAYLGVDIGTSSSKGVLVLPDGDILRTASRAHTVSRPAPGHVEMDPEVWWEEFVALAGELTAPGDVEVAAVGVSGMGPCVVLTDDRGTVLRPAILYGVDTRATAQIERLDAELGREAILDRAGSVLSSQAVGPKIAWVREHEPDVYARARRLFMPASWLAHRLTGEYVLDHHSASQCTPLYDTRALDWYAPWAEHVAPGLDLPALRWPGERAGVTRREVAGIPAGVPVITGTIDAWSEAVSVDAQNPGDLMLMYGTTMFLIATVPERVTSELMWGTVGAFEGTRNLAGGMATSGAITSWLRDLTGGTDYPTLLAEAAASGPGARGLLALPYFAGERTPIFDPDARGVIVGLTLSHTRGDLYRAVLEATAFGVRHNVDALRAAGARIDRVVAVGGGTQGELWTQIVSDVTGLPQTIPTRTIGASYGAAYLAARLVEDVSMASWNPAAEVREPDPRATALYDDLYRHYLDLYPATRDVVHALARLQHEGAS